MAVAHGNSFSRSKSCNCYAIPGLIAPILETFQTSRLEECYILGDELGLGQFGVIRKCMNVFTGEHLACKSIPKVCLVTSEDVCSIKLEIEIMSKLSDHPNVVELKAVYEEENHIHLVMEFCAGGELYHQLEKNGRFLEPNARVLFYHLMEVVMYCHDNGIIHRDLKPENILFSTKSPSSPIKLADFGLATYIKSGQLLTRTVGSPFYIAPEVLAGRYTQAADVWSAGVILYILLSGIPPFWGETKSSIFDAVRATELKFPAEHWDCISVSAKDLIVKMLCRDPNRRLTASQVLEHCWMSGCIELPTHETISNHKKEHFCASTCSFSNPLDQAFSFGSGSTPPNDAVLKNSIPALSCNSSFSSFLVDSTPRTPQGCFSFHDHGEPDNLELSSVIQSMPSFAFFSQLSTNEVIGPTSDPCFSCDNMETNHNSSETNKAGMNIASRASSIHGRRYQTFDLGTIIPSRASSIHGKRNPKIDLGEHEQLDIVMTESIIRWLSCHLPSAAPSSPCLLI